MTNCDCYISFFPAILNLKSLFVFPVQNGLVQFLRGLFPVYNEVMEINRTCMSNRIKERKQDCKYHFYNGLCRVRASDCRKWRSYLLHQCIESLSFVIWIIQQTLYFAFQTAYISLSICVLIPLCIFIKTEFH